MVIFATEVQSIATFGAAGIITMAIDITVKATNIIVGASPRSGTTLAIIVVRVGIMEPHIE